MASPVVPDPRYGTEKDPFYVTGNVTTSRAAMNMGAYKVNVPGTMERINQPFYSYQLYPAAGAAQLSFFQNQTGGNTTLLDTNMTAQGQLPSPQMFLIQGISVEWYPGQTSAPPVLTRADAATGALNDMYAVFRSGVFSLSIGSKNYLTQSPLMSLPPRSHYNAATAVTSATTAAAALQTIVQIPFADGPVFMPVPLLLESNQNFAVNISFPAGAVAVPSGDALARIGVVLHGVLQRPAQ